MEQDTYGPMMPAGNTQKIKHHSSSDEENVIGPVLPPHLRKRKHSESDSDDDNPNSPSVIGPAIPAHLVKSRREQPSSILDSNVIGPVFPPHLRKNEGSGSHAIGPVLPPSFQNKCKDSHDSCSDDDHDDSIGPALPPGFGQRDVKQNVSIGPVLPPGFKKTCSDTNEEECDDVVIGPAMPPGFKKVNNCSDAEDEDSFGPALPPGFQQSSAECDDNDVIGPLPSEMMSGNVAWSTAAEIEQRARKMKDKLTDKLDEDNQPKQRESWMTELPTGMKKNLGLTARGFSTRVMPEKDKDTSAWTDTPADRERKMREAERRSSHTEPSVSSSSKLDRKYEETMSKHDKSKRGKSLLEMHEKKRKKKKKKEKDKPKERQPFDRDRDLQVNKFDEAQRKSIIKKSQQLNSRFSHAGSTSSFL